MVRTIMLGIVTMVFSFFVVAGFVHAQTTTPTDTATPTVTTTPTPSTSPTTPGAPNTGFGY
jgi:hypothetical protein